MSCTRRLIVEIEGSATAFGFGVTAGIYGNYAHDPSQSWYSGWSSSVTVVVGGGAAASVYGAGAGVHISASNVSQLNPNPQNYWANAA